ncbi:hypothetical protein AYO45_00725 [Gammaproteobacteria bacterium SCGC AG-212-F23]|nr:hypothetical protein AYO45_00725 [Gammaproteobacteria bacterium SCGC AG-212-F23]
MMKKILNLIAMMLLSLNTAFALQLSSDVNGVVTVSEPQLHVGDQAPQVTLMTPDFKKKEIGGLQVRYKSFLQSNHLIHLSVICKPCN